MSSRRGMRGRGVLCLVGMCLLAAALPSEGAPVARTCIRHGGEASLPENQGRFERALGRCANFTASSSACRHACRAHVLAQEFPLCGSKGAGGRETCERVCHTYTEACGAPGGECRGRVAEGSRGCSMGPYPPELWPSAAQPQDVARPGAARWAVDAHEALLLPVGAAGAGGAARQEGRVLADSPGASASGYVAPASTEACKGSETLSLVDGGRPFSACPVEEGSCKDIMKSDRYSNGIWLEQPTTMRSAWSEAERWFLPLPFVLLREFFGAAGTPPFIEVCVFDRRYVLGAHWVARLASPDYITGPHNSRLTVQSRNILDEGTSGAPALTKKYQYSIFLPTDSALGGGGAVGRRLLAGAEAGQVYPNTDFAPLKSLNYTVSLEEGVGWMQLAGRRGGAVHRWYTFLGCHDPCTVSHGSPAFNPRIHKYTMVVREAYSESSLHLEVAALPGGAARTVKVNGVDYTTDGDGLLTEVPVPLEGAVGPAAPGFPSGAAAPSVVTIEAGGVTYEITIVYDPPVATVDFGDFCTTSIECITNNCTSAGVCGSGVYGLPCASSDECKSALCEPFTSTCGPARVGGECAGDRQCISGRCDAALDVCLPAPFDGACEEGRECLTSKCVGGKCGAGTYGMACRADLGGRDCVSGLCEAGYVGGPTSCGPAPFDFPCSADGDCLSQRCGPRELCEKAALGGYCKTDVDCVSEHCNTAISQCAKVRYLAPCQASSDCESANCDSGKCELAARGGACERNSDCLSLDCSWSAAESQSICGQAGYGVKCDRNADCRSDICESNEQFGPHPTCGPAPFGFPCAGDAECKSGRCTGRQCSKGADGFACTAGAECLSEYCDFETAKCERAPLGFPCERADQCWSLSCLGTLINGRINQACGPAPFGYSCGRPEECQSLSCDLSIGACAKLSVGSLCSSSEDCASGNCGVDGVCGLVLENFLCRSDAECSSGNCNTTGTVGYCGRVRYGSSCNADADCVSNSCSLGAAAAEQGKLCGQSKVAFGCRGDFECTSGECSGGFCAPGVFGFECRADSECYSGTCVGGSVNIVGRCATHEDGQKCAEDFECVSGACSGGTCTPVP